MTQTKFKLALAALALLGAGGVGLLLSGIKDVGVWIAWIGAVAAMPTQYSAANWAITSKALGEGTALK